MKFAHTVLLVVGFSLILTPCSQRNLWAAEIHIENLNPAPLQFLSPVLWLKANAGLTGTPYIAGWGDQSGKGNNANQGNLQNRPSLIPNAINYNPALDFDGIDDRLNTTLSINHAVMPKLSILAVYQPDKDNAGSVWGEDNGYWDRFIINHDNTSLNNLVSDGSGGNYNIPGLYKINQSSLSTVLYDQGVSNGSEVHVDGKQVRQFTAQQSGPSNPLQIGSLGINNYPFDGKIAEILVYDRTLTSTERNIAESYLGLKYGLTMDHDYLASNYTASGSGTQGNPIWDKSAHINYHHDVAGIGRDDQTSLDQRQSKSENPGSILEVYNGNLGATFPALNVNSVQTFSQDKSFLIWGNNAGSIASLNRSVLGGNQQAISRIWKIQETGEVGIVSLRIPKASLPVGTSTLFINNLDNTFPDNSTTRKIGLIDDGNYLYTYVDFSDGDMFSFGNGNYSIPDLKSPGGVYADLQLWLKADAGISDTGAIATWEDQSLNTFNAVQTQTDRRPMKFEAAINFNPALKFDGINDALNTSLSINYLQAPQVSIISIYKPSRDFAGSVWGEDDAHWDRFIVDNTRPDLNNLVSDGRGGNDNIPGLFLANQSSLSSVIYDQGQNNSSQVHVNGSLARSFTATQASISNKFQIGALGNYYFPFDGQISEILVYKKKLSSIELQKIHTYLAIKYGISLTHDYLASDYRGSGAETQGSPIWQVNNTYNHDIIGIGRDDNSGLDQKQSKRETTSGLLEIYNGDVTASFPASNGSNTHIFPIDKSFLLVGNNGLTHDTYTLNTYSSTNHIRIPKTWEVKETGSIGTVSVRILKSSLPSSDKYFLFTNGNGDDSFPNNAKTRKVSLTDDGTYLYASLDFADGEIFSFGSICKGSDHEGVPACCPIEAPRLIRLNE